jgi:hypothetical protein
MEIWTKRYRPKIRGHLPAKLVATCLSVIHRFGIKFFWHRFNKADDYLSFATNPSFLAFTVRELQAFSREPKSGIFSDFRGFSTLHRSQIAEPSVYSKSARKTASNDMSLSFIWWFSFLSLNYHSALWIMVCTWWKNENHQMKLEDMSFDAVLRADFEYTLGSAIWLRWRVEKPRKSPKMPLLGSRENACSSLTVKARKLGLVANDR